MNTNQKTAPKLVDLVLTMLREERVEEFDAIQNIGVGGAVDYHNFYMNNVFLGEVHNKHVIMWIPAADDEQLPVKCEYQAADPKFFRHILATVKLITQRHIDMANQGFQRAQYFRW